MSMSCSLHIKSSRNSGKSKTANVVHRTTSETIRLGESEKILNNPSSRQILTISPPLRKPASCSFQITNVSLTNLGEDSADELELDESYTDDISRVTDNETPSYSEESREANEALISNISSMTTTVTVTSEEAGCALFRNERESVTNLSVSTVPNDSESVSECLSEYKQNSASTDSIHINLDKKSDSNSPCASFKSGSVPIPGTRFAKVKVETTKPFRRGRWLCMDYFDCSRYRPKNSTCFMVNGETVPKEVNAVLYMTSQKMTSPFRNHFISESQSGQFGLGTTSSHSNPQRGVSSPCPKRCSMYPDVTVSPHDNTEERKMVSCENTARHVAVVYPFNSLPIGVPISFRWVHL